MEKSEREYLERFHIAIGEGNKYGDVTKEIIESYRGKFMSQDDHLDMLSVLWEEYGLRGYKDGKFWFVDPRVYTPIGVKFPRVSNQAMVFARTGLGNLFLFEKREPIDTVWHLDVHFGKLSVVGTRFQLVIPLHLVSKRFWENKCNGKLEVAAIDKYGPLQHNECYTFVPALALGGDMSVDNLQKVSILENLEILAQLHS